MSLPICGYKNEIILSNTTSQNSKVGGTPGLRLPANVTKTAAGAADVEHTAPTKVVDAFEKAQPATAMAQRLGQATADPAQVLALSSPRGGAELQAQVRAMLLVSGLENGVGAQAAATLPRAPLPDVDLGAFLASGGNASVLQLAQAAQGFIPALQDMNLPLDVLEPVQEHVAQMQQLARTSLGLFNPASAPPGYQPPRLEPLSQFMGHLSGTLAALAEVPGVMQALGSAMLAKTAPTGETGQAYGADEGQSTPNPSVKAAQNMTSQEIEETRQKIKDGLDDDDKIVELAKDPKAMALATPEEKAKMIQELKNGWTTDTEDRAMLNIAESCTSKEEFEEVMQKSGGMAVANEMDLDEAKKHMNMLCGMWGHSEWATDKAAAKLAENALLDPGKGAAIAGVAPPGLPRAEATQGQRRAGSAEEIIDNQEQRNHERSADIHREPKAYKELIMANAMRKEEGKPPIDWKENTAKVRDILDDKSLSDGKKKQQIEQVRKQMGVDEPTMRELFTERHTEIFRTGAAEVGAQGDALVDTLRQQLTEAEQTQGKESPEAQELRRHIKDTRKKCGTEKERLGDAAKLAESLYPPPKSFLEGVVDFVKSMGQFLLSALDLLAPLLNFIPGVGSALFAAYEGVKLVVSAVKGDIGGIIDSVASLAGGVGGVVGGVAGNVLKTGAAAVERGKAVVDAAVSGDPLAVLGAGTGMVGTLRRAGPAVTTWIPQTKC